jgi:hypothetical protein
VLEPGCKSPLILDAHGNVVRVLPVNGGFSYAGVSQNGERFALQLTASGSHERFVIFSVKTGERMAEIKPDRDGEAQSWTAFSPDASMFVVGSPLKLTLYRLPEQNRLLDCQLLLTGVITTNRAGRGLLVQ